jgi:hypothetical protein
MTGVLITVILVAAAVVVIADVLSQASSDLSHSAARPDLSSLAPSSENDGGAPGWTLLDRACIALIAVGFALSFLVALVMFALPAVLG